MIIEVTKFRTDDGEEFDTLPDAQQYEAVTALAGAIEESGNSVYGEDARDLALWLLVNYDVRPKEKT